MNKDNNLVTYMVRSFKFILKVGVEESIVRFYTRGAFTIDSSTPTLRINLNELMITVVQRVSHNLTDAQKQ
jgi:hypothetical protein